MWSHDCSAVFQPAKTHVGFLIYFGLSRYMHMCVNYVSSCIVWTDLFHFLLMYCVCLKYVFLSYMISPPPFNLYKVKCISPGYFWGYIASKREFNVLKEYDIKLGFIKFRITVCGILGITIWYPVTPHFSSSESYRRTVPPSTFKWL